MAPALSNAAVTRLAAIGQPATGRVFRAMNEAWLGHQPRGAAFLAALTAALLIVMQREPHDCDCGPDRPEKYGSQLCCQLPQSNSPL
ncbi:hypothetical protein W822_07010 [Advenella kashmirensis W13003]|uniref:Uncharacterized protein n=1 Tax=Advenella kashmirensis W13003 TaxID=1424334 RepID=V8QVU1_9BURK|nr:hypothetical protein W822_07010 [Advenella kashmirensis W13003]